VSRRTQLWYSGPEPQEPNDSSPWQRGWQGGEVMVSPIVMVAAPHGC
jgi:hypothetical protein